MTSLRVAFREKTQNHGVDTPKSGLDREQVTARRPKWPISTTTIPEENAGLLDSTAKPTSTVNALKRFLKSCSCR